MGRATIVSGGTDGRYTIALDYGSAVRDARVAKLTAKIAELEARALWQQELLDGFAGGLESIEHEFNALVSEFVALSNAVPRDQAAMDAKRKQIDEKTKELLKQQEWTASAQADLGLTKSAIKATMLERGTLLTAVVSETRQAWCTDLTESASGPVATLEVPGESALILIQPGAPSPTAIHGALVAREVQSPGQVFWNAAVLPGWQKFKPTYRWGTITALDQNRDTCTVALADAKSSAQQLDVNQAATLSDVPIRYMECNAAVFNVGDRVIVEFTENDWTRPVVVGFVDNPRACGGAGLYCIPANAAAPYGWYPPTTDSAGVPINDGKGSIAYLGDAAAPPGVLYDGTNRIAGTTATIKRTTADGLGTRTARGVRADAVGIPSFGPTEVGNDADPLSFSSIGRMSFEWISKTGAYIATAFDNCRVNGRDLGRPEYGTPYRVFVPNPEITEGTPTAFCITEQYGNTFRLYRRPLAGNSSVIWTFVSLFNVTTISPPLSNEYLKKIITNDAASVVTMWFADGPMGRGCLDFAIPGGAATWTPAEVTFANDYDKTYPVNYYPETITDTFTSQISVDYVNSAKAFATITGTKTDFMSASADSRRIEETITADFWGVSVQISHYLLEWEGTQEDWTDGDGVDRVRVDRAKYASLQSKQIYFFGGAGDPILYTTKNYAHTLFHQEHFEDANLSGLCTVGDTACFEREGRDVHFTIPAMTYGSGMVHNGTTVSFSTLTRPAYSARHQLYDTYALPPEAGGVFTTFYSTWLQGEWARITRAQPGGGYWAAGFGTFADVARRFGTFFVPYAPRAFNFSGYHSTATSHTDVNLRCFHGFAILSHPVHVEEVTGFLETETLFEGLNWPLQNIPMPADAQIAIDPAQWQTYCSDASALARYALDLSMTPSANRLKYLQLASSS